VLIQFQLVLIPLLLLFAALFAAAEAALFSLSRLQLETLSETRPAVYRRIWSLISRPDALLSTLIIGNECLNIMIGTLVVSLMESQLPTTPEKWVAVLSVLVSSLLLLTFSEILPKILAFRLPVLMASALVFPTSWAHVLFAPLRKIFLGLSSKILRVLGIKAGPPSAVNEKEFLTLVEAGAESGSLDRDEKELIFNVFSFSDLTVSSVMTPWSKVFTVSDSSSVQTMLDQVKKKTFSRIPVVSNKDRRVAGILYTKELLKILLSKETTTRFDSLKGAIFPPYIVSTHKKVAKLFREFKQKKVHFALVVDEYGKQLGIVTLEDVLNALFKLSKRPEERT